MADTAWFRGEGGGLHEFALPLPDVYAAQERQGRLIRVDGPSVPVAKPAEPKPEPVSEPEPVEADEPAESEADVVDGDPVNVRKPKQASPKDVWVAFAVEVHGVDQGVAEAMTKAELIKQYG